MTGSIHSARQLFDPRGRANRQNLLVAAIIAVTLELALAMGPFQSSESWLSPAAVIKGLVLWICCASVIRRLHDMDLSGWWLPGGMALACMWTTVVAVIAVLLFGMAVLQPGHPGAVVVLALVMLPVLGATLWLHLTPGTAVRNRFGAPEGLENVSNAPTHAATAITK